MGSKIVELLQEYSRMMAVKGWGGGNGKMYKGYKVLDVQDE